MSCSGNFALRQEKIVESISSVETLEKLKNIWYCPECGQHIETYFSSSRVIRNDKASSGSP